MNNRCLEVRVCFQRWVDVVLMALLGGLLVAGIFYLKGWTDVSEELSIVSVWISLLLTLFVWAVISALSGWNLSLKMGFWKHPPSAFAVVFGYSICLGLTEANWGWFGWGILIQAGFCYVGKVLVCVYHHFFNSRTSTSLKNPAGNVSESKHWFLNDDPIENIINDRFQIAGVEKQIVKLISRGENVAVLGKYGSGKSTVIKWATNELLDEYVVCELGAWGRRREGFSSHLLRMATVALKPHIDTLSVVDVPLQYQAALASRGFWGALFASALSSRNPAEVLKRVDRVLQVAQKKLLIVVEDVDRNLDKALLKEELPSLLDRIDGTSNIQFVLAVDAEATEGAWLLRVASCVDIPVVEIPQGKKEIKDFLTLMDEEFPDLIDPISSDDREALFFWTGKKFNELLDHPCYSPCNSLAEILTNPRELKAIFRETWERWGVLKGEVDRDELLVLTALKIGRPAIHQFLVSERIRFVDPEKHKSKDLKATLLSDLEAHLVSSKETLTPALKTLLHYLFFDVNHSLDGTVNKPQSIALQDYGDYLNRIKRVQCLESVKDQEVLKLLKQVRDQGHADSSHKLAKNAFENEDWVKKINQFKFLLKEDDVRRSFVDACFLQLSEREDVGRFMGPADDLMKMVTHFMEKVNDDGWSSDHFFQLSKAKLRLAHRLERFLNSESVEDAFYEKVKLYWLKDPSRIISSVSKEGTYALSEFIVSNNGGSDSDYYLESGRYVRPENWKSLAGSFLAASKKAPALILPALTLFLTNEESKFMDDLAVDLFGETLDELAGLLVQTDPEGMDDYTEKQYSTAKKWAEKRM